MGHGACAASEDRDRTSPSITLCEKGEECLADYIQNLCTVYSLLNGCFIFPSGLVLLPATALSLAGVLSFNIYKK